MDCPWVAIQRNPKSGAGRLRRPLFDLIRHLRKLGLNPRLFSRRERLGDRLQDERSRQNLLAIVAAGGDGTVGDVINRYPGIPLAVLPLGTENLFARYLGIPPSGRLVAEMIAAARKVRFDVCSLGERKFLLMAGFGIDADVIRRVHQLRTGHITRLSYLQPILQSLRKYSHREMRVYVGDEMTPMSARWVMASNLPVYALGLPLAPSARGNDGMIDLTLFRHSSAFQMIRYLYKVSLLKHEELDDVQTVRATHFRVESDGEVPIQIDGDPAGKLPAIVRVLPAAAEVFVPPTFSARL